MNTINGSEYGWADVNVILPGSTRPVENITGIEYDTAREKKNIRGRGSRPVSRARGSKEYTGSVTLLLSEVIAMQAGLPAGKDLTDLAPFPITVSYAQEGGPITTDRLVYCEFTKIPKALKEGDLSSEVKLELVIGEILYNV